MNPTPHTSLQPLQHGPELSGGHVSIFNVLLQCCVIAPTHTHLLLVTWPHCHLNFPPPLPQRWASQSRDTGSLNSTGDQLGREMGNSFTDSISSSHMASPAQLLPSRSARDNASWPQQFHQHQDPSSPLHLSSLMCSFFSPPSSKTHEEQTCPEQQASGSLLPYLHGGKHAGFGTLPSNRPSASNKPLFPPRQSNHLSLIAFLFFPQGILK